MSQLTPEGQQLINNLAQRYHFSTDAVLSLLQSVQNGNGSMAQFSHPEFGGSGQWMRGGMIMIGDMFNNGLKNSVSNLCQELANLLANQPIIWQSQSFQSQNPGHNTAPVSLFVPATGGNNGNWWPQGLMNPNSTGSQNNVRYAYFASIRRLAIEAHGHVTLYDTLDHQIGGFSQQQSGGSSVTFTSQHGIVDVQNLPVISVDNVPTTPSMPVPTFTDTHVNPAPVAAQEADIFGAIEKLAGLRDKGILSDAEFNAKKSELLSRL
ncbi:MAG: SHOCT domain-containing protein [Methylovulum sp.]|nr:SHOCT domain-containing protein [Methylovulum sp.]